VLLRKGRGDERVAKIQDSPGEFSIVVRVMWKGKGKADKR
jgi:hypothetical protein